MDDVFELYAVIHALQIHAQASIDYLLYTCAVLKKGVETPLRCVDELVREGLIKEEEGDTLRRMIRFRDIVVHRYGDIDVEKVRRFSKPAGIEK